MRSCPMWPRSPREGSAAVPALQQKASPQPRRHLPRSSSQSPAKTSGGSVRSWSHRIDRAGVARPLGRGPSACSRPVWGQTSSLGCLRSLGSAGHLGSDTRHIDAASTRGPVSPPADPGTIADCSDAFVLVPGRDSPAYGLWSPRGWSGPHRRCGGPAEWAWRRRRPGRATSGGKASRRRLVAPSGWVSAPLAARLGVNRWSVTR